MKTINTYRATNKVNICATILKNMGTALDRFPKLIAIANIDKSVNDFVIRVRDEEGIVDHTVSVVLNSVTITESARIWTETKAA